MVSFDVGPMFPCHKDHEAMKNSRDSAFSLCGLEVGLPGLQLPSFAKCDALPKGDLFDIFVKGNPIPTRRLRSLRAAARSISSA